MSRMVHSSYRTYLLNRRSLGDSGFLHIGPNKIRHGSNAQVHAFNTPYQISKIPRKMLIQAAIFGGGGMYSEMPDDADITSLQVEHGDVLVFATDGVWDNVTPEEVLGVTSRIMKSLHAWLAYGDEVMANSRLHLRLTAKPCADNIRGNILSDILALAIAQEARACSLNPRRASPFSKKARVWYPEESWQGGKPDDICVLVAIATRQPT